MRFRSEKRLPFDRELELVVACVLLLVVASRHSPNAFNWLKPQHAAPAPVSFNVPGLHGPSYYLGGRPVRGGGTRLDIGRRTDAGLFAAFWSWTAAAPDKKISSCLLQTPPPLDARTGARPISADAPGFYGAPWVARLNGSLIAALNVVVPRDGTAPVPDPEFEIYHHYNGTQLAPSFARAAAVEVSRGTNALLYRMFIDGPVTCIDLVVPNGASAGTAYVYYPYRGSLFESRAAFTLQR